MIVTPTEQLIFDWLNLATDLVITFERQELADAPKPTVPFVSIWLGSDRSLSGTRHREVDTDDLDQYSAHHESTLRLRVFGEDARADAKHIQESLDTPQVRALFRARNAQIVRQPLSVLHRPSARTRYLGETQIDFRLRYRDEYTIGPIDTIGSAEITLDAE